MDESRLYGRNPCLKTGAQNECKIYNKSSLRPVHAPTSWSLLQGFDVTPFQLTGRVKCKTNPSNVYRDMYVFFHFQDPAHFYYVHFSAKSDPLHNIIGLVNGKDREKINFEPEG